VSSELSGRDADEGDEVQVCQGSGTALIVFDEAAEAPGLDKGALDHPPAGKQHEVALGLWQLAPSKAMPCERAAAARFSPL